MRLFHYLKKLKYLCFFLGIAIFCFGAKGGDLNGIDSPSGCPDPWFTGPLLAPSAHVIPGGYINVEPYVFYTVNTGTYDNDWNVVDLPNFTTVNFQFLLYLGITPWMDILFISQADWNNTQGVSTLVFGDLPIELDIQLIDNEPNPAIPALKFYIIERFPTGPFQKGDPERFLTDLSGSGSFQTTFGLVVSSLFEFSGCHFLEWRINGFTTLFSNVPVKGINTYGGAPDTDGTIHPGLEWGGIFALQYSLTQNWAFALDIEGIYGYETTFKGFRGKGNPPLGIPQNVSFSIAPAIEYNFSENLGIIAGAWLSFAGKNAPQFFSGVIAINYYGPISPKGKTKFRSLGGSGGSSAGSGGR